MRARRSRSVAFWLLLVVAVNWSSASDEYILKAQFVERFIRFIDWPAASQGKANTKSPFVIGVVGKSEVHEHLLAVVAKRKIKGRTAEVRLLSIDDLEGVANCQVVFISKCSNHDLTTLLGFTAEKPILTVSDSKGYAKNGVLINIYLNRDDACRFEINRNAVERTGLRFSSNLLRLARLVGEE